jgi:hypothetical protein
MEQEFKGVFSPGIVQNELKKRAMEYIAKNHTDFFNQEVEEIKNMSIEEVKARIEHWAEAFFTVDKESIRTKTKLQAAGKIFNEKLAALNAQEREDLRLTDQSYVPGPDLGNPMHKKAQKKIVAKKSLEDDLKALLGDKADAALIKLMGGGHIEPDKPGK